jgi:ribonuclease HII
MSLRIAGVDEAGRGPLAGPVFAAAVILNPESPIAGITDSKLLEPAQREQLAHAIRQQALAFSVAWADVEEIDSLNILGATLLAMRRAVQGLTVRPDAVYVDGNRAPFITDLVDEVQTVVDGDRLETVIGAASILAKTARDALMQKLDLCFPNYGLALHKGYPTPAHQAALRRWGPSVQHRWSFAPVREAKNLLDL